MQSDESTSFGRSRRVWLICTLHMSHDCDWSSGAQSSTLMSAWRQRWSGPNMSFWCSWWERIKGCVNVKSLLPRFSSLPFSLLFLMAMIGSAWMVVSFGWSSFTDEDLSSLLVFLTFFNVRPNSSLLSTKTRCLSSALGTTNKVSWAKVR